MNSSGSNSPDNQGVWAALTGVSDQADQTGGDTFIPGSSKNKFQDINRNDLMNELVYQNNYAEPTPANTSECHSVPSPFDSEGTSEGNDYRSPTFDRSSFDNNRTVPTAEQVETQSNSDESSGEISDQKIIQNGFVYAFLLCLFSKYGLLWDDCAEVHPCSKEAAEGKKTGITSYLQSLPKEVQKYFRDFDSFYHWIACYLLSGKKQLKLGLKHLITYRCSECQVLTTDSSPRAIIKTGVGNFTKMVHDATKLNKLFCKKCNKELSEEELWENYFVQNEDTELLPIIISTARTIPDIEEEIQFKNFAFKLHLHSAIYYDESGGSPLYKPWIRGDVKDFPKDKIAALFYSKKSSLQHGSLTRVESNGAYDPFLQNGTLTIHTQKFNVTDGSFVPSQVTIELPQGYMNQPAQRDGHSKNSGHLDTELEIRNKKIDSDHSSRQKCAEDLKISGSKLLNPNRYELTFEKAQGNRGRPKLYSETAELTGILSKEEQARRKRKEKDRSDSTTDEKLKAKNEAFDAYESEHKSACELLRDHTENHEEFSIYYELNVAIRQVDRSVKSMPTMDVKQFWTQDKILKQMGKTLESFTTTRALHSAIYRYRRNAYDENLVELASFYKTLKNHLIDWKKLAQPCIYNEEEHLEPSARRRRIDSEPPLPAPNRPEASQDDLQQEEMVECLWILTQSKTPCHRRDENKLRMIPNNRKLVHKLGRYWIS